MARQIKATQENNYTIEVVWHKAKNFPKKSGDYLYFMKGGHITVAGFSAKWKIYNADDCLDLPYIRTEFHKRVVAWAKIPNHKFMVDRTTNPVHDFNSREQYLCVRDEDDYADFLWYNKIFDAFNSTDDDTLEKAKRFEIEVDRWCRIAPPTDF